MLSYKRRVAKTNLTFKRFLFDAVDWRERLICIKGPRGVGKTTMILQYIKSNFANLDEAIFLSLDNLWFATHSLQEVVDYHYSHGGTHLFLDEVHKYKDWQTAIKNIYDDYPDLKIVYTGSSMLKMDDSQGDLSRRVAVYDMPGLSFREYLQLEHKIELPPYDIEEITERHSSIVEEVLSKCRVLPLFEDYLKRGYYPFYREVYSTMAQRVQEVARTVIETDIPSVENLETYTLSRIKRLLMIITEKVPYQPNISELCRILDTNREQILKMLTLLERGGLISMVCYEPRNIRSLAKPDKILLDNTTLMYSLTGHVDKGTVRETFFNCMMRNVAEVLLSREGDFIVGRDMTFEIGGRKKGFNQIKDMPRSYVAADEIERGYGNKIPLWLIGFLY